MFKGKTAVITGGAGGIGKSIAKAFSNHGAKVCIIDTAPNDCYTGDIGDENVLKEFADKIIKENKSIDFLINNAPPLFKGIDSCSYEDFMYSMRIGAAAPFMLTKLFMDHFASGASIVNISSTRDRMSQPHSESYAAAKGALYALTHSLAVSLAGKVRVNSISPGWIDTGDFNYSGADADQHPAGRVGRPEDISELVIYLCSEKAGFITGENICVDGGMTRQMIYHGDHGWEKRSGR